MVFSRNGSIIIAQEQARRRIRMMSIVMMPMISNSPRRATLWATPVSEREEAYGYVPMILCESEPGNINFFQKDKTSLDTEE